ncbi:hypothetical protein TTHERM_000647247 (macronuclear) [Tetrahymena thermophila SB210]|uniref:Uncharacterized protein n=1 Tax=Tetrahymena thermophila (strain SB210) TaxID=312017 RepID=W7X3U0_TETTS|nr:hypothetical protein TTHERM_000647247 [Tetrahymena thermophila SB210]EWS71088.1 hypothetical protein TTHERM_000647247 [Tetrahymena thermophila SB210]|eukprot:XP_012656387.1 hypothetical protein TTHERM_000647247 [Tetrahymena thermophila SB210]
MVIVQRRLMESNYFLIIHLLQFRNKNFQKDVLLQMKMNHNVFTLDLDMFQMFRQVISFKILKLLSVLCMIQQLMIAQNFNQCLLEFIIQNKELIQVINLQILNQYRITQHHCKQLVKKVQFIQKIMLLIMKKDVIKISKLIIEKIVKQYMANQNFKSANHVKKNMHQGMTKWFAKKQFQIAKNS